MSHPEDPRTFFGRHHQDYVTSHRHAKGEDLSWLIEGLHPEAGQHAIDIATGGGHTALRLAEQGVLVTALDITPEMLREVEKAAAARHLVIQTALADAEQLPFADNSLDLAACRRAAHHFRRIPVFLEEVQRVLKPGGRLGISDMTASQAGKPWLNHLEQLRDPSHHEAWSPDEWYQGLVEVGFHDIIIQLTEEPLAYTDWLAPVSPQSPEGRASLDFMAQEDAPQELVRGPLFIKRRILIWAQA